MRKMNCFWCENKIDEDERYLVVEQVRTKNKLCVCDICMLDDEASKEIVAIMTTSEIKPYYSEQCFDEGSDLEKCDLEKWR